jgi:hypothetical protein
VRLEEIAILALATWRISSLLVREDGPFYLFMRLRHKVGVRYDKLSQPYATNEVARGLLCLWCTSVWVGIALALCFLLWPQAVVGLSLPFALSAVAVLVDECVGNTPNDTGGYDG